MTLLAPTLQAFFTERLMTQQNASRHTVASYRDCLRLLVCFARTSIGAQPSHLTIEQVDATLVGAFLDHLEHDRGVSIATRNARLAAVHSLFRFAALRHPEHAELISRVLAIPVKRAERAIVAFLTAEEADALLAAPDLSRRAGRRDHALLALAVQTGLRVSEITGLRVADVHLGAGPHVRCTGKGRKDRATPLTRQTVAIMRGWLAERAGGGDNPVFPHPNGKPLGPLPRPGLPRPGRQAAGHRRGPQAHPAARRHGSSPLPLSIEQEDQPAYAKAHLRDEDAGKRH
jgi:integrase/recombinase XerD